MQPTVLTISSIKSYYPPSEKRLPEEPSCGGKHDTLIKMHAFLKEYPIEGVSVPKPEGVPSEEVERHLQDHAPEFFRCWKELGEIYGDSHPHFFDDLRVMALIKEAQDAIQKAFAEFSLPPHIATLDSGEYYMVRSTGAEDSKKTANAGGNKSCSYVPRDQIALKMGEVVASYVDKRSLLNRIRAGENPFAIPLALPVTVQPLIGEAIGGATDPDKIPISVVLFTNEPLYIGNESFRIMKMSGAYGHGEGVVGNRGVLTDTAFVLQSLDDPSKLYVWYDNQEKGERLAPVQTAEGVKLELLKNPSELVHRRALSPEMVKRLFLLGEKMEKFFSGPTDMELVLKEDVIHIVQARPINRELKPPTYLELDPSSPQQNTKVLVPGSGRVVLIDNREEVLVADTLEIADEVLQEQHKLVISRQDEPTNSHPTIQMTERNMPCLYHEEGLEAFIGELSLGKLLAICMQQGVRKPGQRAGD